jgi:coenzyme PQQ synthesis protein D (PqqD)
MAFVLHEKLSLATTEYGAIMLDRRNGDYWQLNRIAATMVGLLRDGRDVEGVVAELSRRFDVADEQIRHDAERLVTTLRTRGLAVS